jgi:hypothetical protein
MSKNLERRLARLETQTAPRERVFIWQSVGQSPGEAVAARFPHGVPDKVEPVILGWAEPEESEG